MLHLQKFDWDHLGAYTLLYNQVNGFDLSAKMFEQRSIQKILELPEAKPESNIILAYWNNEAVGFISVVREASINRIVLTGGVIEGYQRKGIGRSLLTTALEQLDDYHDSVCHIQAGINQIGLRALLESLNFYVVNTFSTMVLAPSKPVPIDHSSKYTISTFKPGKDETLLTDLQNEVFKGSWGFAPNTVSEISARMTLDRTESGGVKFVSDTANQPIAYCWTLRAKNTYGHVGWISMVGARPKHRCKGAGLMATISGINYLVGKGVEAIELEVDTSNVAAIELYRKLGFRISFKTLWFERKIS